MVKQELIKNRIKKAFTKNPSGFTLRQDGILLNLNKGFCYAITQNANKDFNLLIDNFFKLVKENKTRFYFIGGWFNDGLYYLDISFITNKKSRAIFQGIKHRQLSIFCFNDFSCINTSFEINKEIDLNIFFADNNAVKDCCNKKEVKEDERV